MKPPRSPSVDEARLRPHLRQGARGLTTGIEAASGPEEAAEADKQHGRIVTPSPGELRGVPVVGRAGGPGAIRGSNPVAELLRREGQRSR